MADTVPNNSENGNREREIVVEAARMLGERGGEDTVALDVTGLSDWTDYFVITTATSQGHARGLMRRIGEFLKETEIAPMSMPRHVDLDVNGWILIDCGFFVIHVMSGKAREFYELERLWYSGETVYGEKSSA